MHILKLINVMIYNELLWYDLFSLTLSDLGYELSPYELCIVNKVTNEHFFTIGWFVGGEKVAHIDDSVNSMIPDNIEENFGKISRTIGNKHTFLGMDIKFIGRNKVAVSTPHNIDKDLEVLLKP